MFVIEIAKIKDSKKIEMFLRINLKNPEDEQKEAWWHNPVVLEDFILNNQCYIIYDDKFPKRILGCIGFRYDIKFAEISFLAIRKKNRNAGIGRDLLLYILHHLKEHKQNEVRVGTYYEFNAGGFYERLGFKKFKTLKKYCEYRIKLTT